MRRPAIKRLSFAKLPEGLAPPDLVEVQRRSYWDFLQLDVPKPKRRNIGLQAAFLETFPIVKRHDMQQFGRFRTKELVLGYMNAVAAGDLETVIEG